MAVTKPTYPVTDMLDQPICVDDFVVFYSNIYKVKEVGVTPNLSGQGPVRMKLVDASKSTKTVVKYSKDICKPDQHQVLLWVLKKGYN